MIFHHFVRLRINRNFHAKRLRDTFCRNIIMRRPDASGGKHIIHLAANFVHRFHNLALDIRHHANLGQHNPLAQQLLRNPLDIRILRPPGQDFIAYNNNSGFVDFRMSIHGPIFLEVPSLSKRDDNSNMKMYGNSMKQANKINSDGIEIHTKENFEGMRRAGKLAAETLDMITPHVVPGVTTEELDKICNLFITKHGAIPAPLNYKGFPKSICTSVNHVICHGIPSEKKLLEGDIVNIDVTVILDGWYGDTSRMYLLGDKISVKARKLVDVTYDCMMAGIEVVKPGAHLGDIGAAIQAVAEKNRFSVVRDFCGHGLGRVFHAPPSVNHFGTAGTGPRLEPGMFFTIEPMINAGDWPMKVLSDGWTAVTRDRSLSAQFEHTLAVTDDGFEIFTHSPKGLIKPPYAI